MSWARWKRLISAAPRHDGRSSVTRAPTRLRIDGGARTGTDIPRLPAIQLTATESCGDADPLSPGHVDELELDVVRIPEDDHRVGDRIAGVDHAGVLHA